MCTSTYRDLVEEISVFWFGIPGINVIKQGLLIHDVNLARVLKSAFDDWIYLIHLKSDRFRQPLERILEGQILIILDFCQLVPEGVGGIVTASDILIWLQRVNRLGASSSRFYFHIQVLLRGTIVRDFHPILQEILGILIFRKDFLVITELGDVFQVAAKNFGVSHQNGRWEPILAIILLIIAGGEGAGFPRSPPCRTMPAPDSSSHPSTLLRPAPTVSTETSPRRTTVS